MSFAAAGRSIGWACERNGYPSIGPVSVRAYQTKIEFLVPLDLMASINLWVSKHSARLRADAT